MREPGYYWVMPRWEEEEWQVGRYQPNGRWRLFDVEASYFDTDFIDIDENQIKRGDQ